MRCPYCGGEVNSIRPANSANLVGIKCVNCGTWIQLDSKGRLREHTPLEAPSTNLAESRQTEYRSQRKSVTLADVKNYFLHGLVFSLLMMVMLIGWGLVFAFLIVIGSIIGLILGLVFLVFLVGWLNVKLTRFFWHFDAGSEWTELLFHGFVLLMALLLVGIPHMLLSWLIPNSIISIVLFIVYCFVDGYVAKNLAIALF